MCVWGVAPGVEGLSRYENESRLAFLIITAAPSNISPVEQSETADGIGHSQL